MSVTKIKDKNGKFKSYRVQISYPIGNGEYKRFSKSGFKTKREAQAFESLARKRYEETGMFEESKEQKQRRNMLLDQVYEEFVEVGAIKYQPSTLQGIKRNYKKWISPTLGKKRISSLDYKTLQGFFNDISNKGKCLNNNVRHALSVVLKYAIKQGIINMDYLSLVDVTGVDNKQERQETISYDDLKVIKARLLAHDSFKLKYEAYAMALEIGYFTGLRISEALALEKSDFDFINDTINVDKKLVYMGLKKSELYTTHQMKTQNSKATLPLIEPLKSILLDWFDKNPYDLVLCDEEGYYINPTTMATSIKRLIKDTGIDFHYHMLRHSLATNLHKARVEPAIAQRLLRHGSIDMTISTYTHIDSSEKINALNDTFKTICTEFAPS